MAQPSQGSDFLYTIMSPEVIFTLPAISAVIGVIILDQTSGKHTWHVEDIENLPRPFSFFAPILSYILPTFRLPMIQQGPSEPDAVQVASLLAQRLPADLVPDIIDMAELWVDIPLASSNCKMRVTENEAGRIYLLADIPSTFPPHALRSLTFRVTSRDQGWSETAFHYTYKESWTWFEVAILPPGTDESQGPFTGRHIITNINADFEWHTHDVTWRYDDENEDIRDIVRSLKPGYKVAICAWARYRNWVNRVQSARIDCQVHAVRRM
ncbi:hypothetical protein LTS17_007681 [Exophiala oligosperma]